MFSVSRWLFAPITTWRARRLVRDTDMDPDTAWRTVRITDHPNELPFAVYEKNDPGD